MLITNYSLIWLQPTSSYSYILQFFFFFNHRDQLQEPPGSAAWDTVFSGYARLKTPQLHQQTLNKMNEWISSSYEEL